MNPWLLGNPPPAQFYTGLVVGMVVVGVIAMLLVPPASRDRRRTLWICTAAVLGGPAMGAALAGLTLVFGQVDPLDRSHLVVSFTFVGTVAGVVASLTIVAVACVKGLCSRNGCRRSSDSEAGQQ